MKLVKLIDEGKLFAIPHVQATSCSLKIYIFAPDLAVLKGKRIYLLCAAVDWRRLN